jgi:hypothetical protein
MTTANVRQEEGVQKGMPGTLVEQVLAEYAEMPGLSITLPQAQRLWAVDRETCEETFRRLVSRGKLRRTSRGRFVRA